MARRNRKAPRRAANRKKQAKKGQVAMMRKIAAEVINKKSETKYVAQQLGDFGGIVNSVLQTPAQLFPMIPTLQCGTESFQRVGARIENLRIKTTFTIWLDNNGNQVQNNNVFVRLYFLRSKKVKNWNQVGLLPANTLLDQGDGTTTDWNNPAPGQVVQYSQMPISNENWIGRHKTVRLIKNTGQPNGVNGTPNTDGRPSATVVHYTNRKAPVSYENLIANPGLAYPTNFCPLFGVVAWSSEFGSQIRTDQIQMVVRNEMYFKDR